MNRAEDTDRVGAFFATSESRGEGSHGYEERRTQLQQRSLEEGREGDARAQARRAALGRLRQEGHEQKTSDRDRALGSAPRGQESPEARFERQPDFEREAVEREAPVERQADFEREAPVEREAVPEHQGDLEGVERQAAFESALEAQEQLTLRREVMALRDVCNQTRVRRLPPEKLARARARRRVVELRDEAEKAAEGLARLFGWNALRR
jgi:hypothetical protein